NLSVIAWFAFLPLIAVSESLSSKQAFWLGWGSGTLAYIGILDWIVVTFRAAHLSFFLAGLCLLLLAMYVGLFWGAWSAFVAETAGSWVSPLAAAAAWVGLEYLRTHLFSGFPWALLGDTQWKQLRLIQIASITGVYGL